MLVFVHEVMQIQVMKKNCINTTHVTVWLVCNFPCDYAIPDAI